MAPSPQPPSPASPTGEQWLIGHGLQELTVAQVGATIRRYRVGERDVLDGFGVREWSDSGRGQVLAPWPNRLGDGRYEFSGLRAQAALDEPELRNAIHGLVRWVPWRLEAQAQNVLSVACTLHPSPGYPFILGLRIEYRLGRDGLSVCTRAENLGETTLPFGLGFHPYLRPGAGSLDLARLRLPATRRLVLDERSLPTGELRPVSGTELDFTAGRAIGATRMDTAFTGLHRDADGLAWASLDDGAGDDGTELWVDDRFNYLMCYTGDTIGDPARRRAAVAIEPMTCPPDAFRSGKDLVVLGPGQEWQGSWGLRPR
jgi:galactose mutarotase-like enzyme